ncbi:MAG: phage protein Gp36 family protein [Victivallaceae bacterium]
MYATLSQLQGRLKDSFENIYEAVDGAFPDAEADLAAANAIVDGYLAGRYAVPVTVESVQALLQHYTLVLACELAYMRSAGDMPEKIKTAVKNVTDALQAIADGKKRLPGVAETTSGQGGASVLSIADPVFTREKMSGF